MQQVFCSLQKKTYAVDVEALKNAIHANVNATGKLMTKIILGSKSPRRREILSLFDLNFSVEIADIDEKAVSSSKIPEIYVEEIARAKGAYLLSKHKNAVIITADTTVAYNGEFLCKPESEEDAFKMLKTLSGQLHIVSSSIVIHFEDQVHSAYENTYVTLRELSDEQILQYIKIFKPFDKAGAYGIQDGGGILIQKIEGNFHNVVGFEVKLLEKLFGNIGINLWQHLKRPATSA